MDPWCHSNVTHKRMEGLVKRSLLCARTKAMEWLVPDNEEAPTLPDDDIVSFTPFHEHGLTMPPHKFLQGLLHHSRSSCSI
jgi:hypothetical protein